MINNNTPHAWTKYFISQFYTLYIANFNMNLTEIKLFISL